MTLRAEILAIGDELIHGALLDTNSKQIAVELERIGLVVQRFVVTSDDPEQMRDTIAASCARADVVIATGGLGPTLDDRTRDVLAEVLGGPLWFDPTSWEQVQTWLKSRSRPVPESNRRQAMFPPKAVPIANPVGTAPAFSVRVGRAMLFALPGVPREMQTLLRDAVLPVLQQLPGLQPTAHAVLRVLGPSEALLGERIESYMVPGRNPAVGITASGGLLTIRIVGSAATASEAAAACEQTAAELRPLLGSWVFAEGTQDLPELVVQRLAAARHTLAFAESCTAGLCAARLADVAGASNVLRGGIVAYANDVKTTQLDVPAALLAAHGAVSEAVAGAMAEGVRARLQADVGIGVTGIAGPGGGSVDKPVGTVCFAVATAAGTRTWTQRIADLGRAFVRERAVFEVWRALLQQ